VAVGASVGGTALGAVVAVAGAEVSVAAGAAAGVAVAAAGVAAGAQAVMIIDAKIISVNTLKNILLTDILISLITYPKNSKDPLF
jgi:hypothetical protein